MFYDPLYAYQPQMISSTPLPNIHPEDIDCIIRSQQPYKGSLYVSNLEAAQNIATLKKLRISSILTCAQGYKLDHPQDLISSYKYFPLSETSTFDLNNYFDNSSNFLKLTLEKTNCIVHCLNGANKSIAVVIAYLIKNFSMSFADSYLYIKRKRKLIDLDQEFQQALKQYQKYLSKIKQKTEQSEQLNKRSNSSSIKHKTQKTNRDMSVQEGLKMFVTNAKNDKQQIKSNYSKSLLSVPSQYHTKQDKNNYDKLLSQCSRISVKNQSSRAVNNSEIRSKKSKTMMQLQNPQNQNNLKIKTENIPNQIPYGIQHKQPAHFNKIISVARQQYIGVKRQLKNSQTSFKKDKSQIIDNNQSNNLKQGLNSVREINSSRLSKSLSHRSENKSQNVESSQLKPVSRHNRSMSYSRSHKIATNGQQAEYIYPQNYTEPIHDFIINPESPQKQSEKCDKLSPSRIKYFSSLNSQINEKMDSIQNQYKSKVGDVRDKYMMKLKQLRK